MFKTLFILCNAVGLVGCASLADIEALNDMGSGARDQIKQHFEIKE